MAVRIIPIVIGLLILGASSAHAQGVITTVAGSTWIFPGITGPPTTVPLGRIRSVVVDPAGNVFAADTGNHLVVKLSTGGVLTVVAGNGIPGFSGDGGPATSASLNFPAGVALDQQGNIYIADGSNNRIRKVSPEGTIATVAGTGRSAFSGDGGPATAASLSFPVGVAVDAAANLYIADRLNSRIRKVSSDGIITTIAGNGTIGLSGDGGPAASASLSISRLVAVTAVGLAVDASGNLYIPDQGNNRIRKVGPDGIISTVVGGGASFGDGGPAISARLNAPATVALDGAGNLYIADTNNLRIRKVGADGIISTVAGNGIAAFAGDGGLARDASFSAPVAVAVDAEGNVYIGDIFNFRLRKVNLDGIISTVAGNGLFKFSPDGGPATSASLNEVTDVAVDLAGNSYIAARLNHRVRKVNPEGIMTTAAGSGTQGFSGDGDSAIGASLSEPLGVAIDAASNLYISDHGNRRVRKVSPQGIITTFAGGGGALGDGGPATSARLSPYGLGVDAAGNVYIADLVNQRIRRVSPGGTITTVAGNGVPGFSGDGGPAASASLRLAFRSAVAVDAAGNVYISDRDNQRIRKVSRDGIITTFAGTGVAGFSGDGGAASNATLRNPQGLALDAGGNLYISDSGNHRVRKISAAGTISTVAGAGVAGFSGDGGLATNALLNEPSGVAVDAAGNLFIAERGNDRIRKVVVVAPSFSVSPASLSFSARTGSAATAPQQLALNSSSTGLAWELVAATTSSGGRWLSVSPAAGQMPATLSVSTDATSLAPGTYQGRIEISAPLATPPLQTVAVTFTVSAGAPTSLSVEPSSLGFQAAAGGTAPPPQSLRIENTGTGALSWTAAAATVSGGWLAISPASGSAPASVQVSVNPAGLAAGSYEGFIIVRSASTNQLVTVSVNLQVTASAAGVLLLSQTSLLFRAVEGGGAEPPQTFGVLNIGSGAVDWRAQVVNVRWLRVSPTGARSEAGTTRVPLLTVAVEPAGLTAGFYTGLIRVTATGANNSPQALKVELQVLPRGTKLGAVVRPTGLIFVAAAGGTPPGSQEVSVATTEATAVEFLSQPIGGDWVRREPDAATTSRDSPGRIVVQPELGSLTAGVYRAGLTVLMRNDGSLHPVSLLFLVLPPGTAAAQMEHYRASLSGAGLDGAALHNAALDSNSVGGVSAQSSQCAPTKLFVQFASLFANFQAAVGWPTIVQVNARDDCGNSAVGGNVVLSFSSGDPALVLTDLKNGQYQGAWRPNSATPQVVVTARGLWRGLQGEATAVAQVGLNPNPQNAFLSQGGVLLGAGFGRGPVAPGSIISLFGRNLAAGDNLADRVPLPRSLGGVRVLIGEKEAPLFYVGPGQVNAQVPSELDADRQLQVLVETDGVPSAPEPLQTVASRPGIFTLGPRFGNQGAILIANTNRLAMPPTSGVPSEPARIGGVVSIYCTGLGSTEPAVPSGQPGPASEPLARVITQVTVSIGGQTAAVSFAGLAPGFVGVYQVNAQVPAGITPGDAVPVVITQGGFRSNTTTIAVR